MRKPTKQSAILLAAGFIVGAASFGIVGLIAIRSNSGLAMKLNGAPQVTPAPTPLGEDPYHTSFADLDTSLSQKKDVAFEHYAIYYLIDIDQNTSGMLRRVENDAHHPELKAFAAQMRARRDDEVLQLLAWQKAWGYTHH